MTTRKVKPTVTYLEYSKSSTLPTELFRPQDLFSHARPRAVACVWKSLSEDCLLIVSNWSVWVRYSSEKCFVFIYIGKPICALLQNGSCIHFGRDRESYGKYRLSLNPMERDTVFFQMQSSNEFMFCRFLGSWSFMQVCMLICVCVCGGGGN